MKALVALASLSLVLLATGCNNGPKSGDTGAPGAAGPGKAAKPAPRQATDAELAAAKVNESGVIPILEYHRIRKGRTTYDRSPEDFRKDLERLYTEGYRPIALHDLLDNKIDVPIGMTPVVLTFDDSSPTQFSYKQDGSLDPDCAFGILKAFHEAHPDFGQRGIFFMNASVTGKPSKVFGDQSTAPKKIQELLAAGMEIGNHTVTHPNLSHLSDERVQAEIAGCILGIQALAPNTVVDTLALPFGIWPKDHKLAAEGSFGGTSYQNKAVLLVGAEPAQSPATRKYDPLRLRRVQACGGKWGITYWLDYLKEHPDKRFVSDGDPSTLTIPKYAQINVDSAKLGTVKLRTY
ncbi:MAG TPA: polysaccharide deacetylase family protein [Chthonomonadaceae bacterium]|nr:polysaccharide deacetylase family protein [Chthonomonadaceae bacterium]